MKIFPFLILFVISCQTKKPNLRSILASPCYWDISGAQHTNTVNSCYKFNENGTCYFFYYNFLNKKKTDSVYRYDDDDVIVSDTWSIERDSIVTARSIEYIVSEYNEDTIYTKPGPNGVIALIRNCRTFREHSKKP